MSHQGQRQTLAVIEPSWATELTREKISRIHHTMVGSVIVGLAAGAGVGLITGSVIVGIAVLVALLVLGNWNWLSEVGVTRGIG